MVLKTPLSRVLGLGAAKEGASHWWWQRMTALALVPLSVWFVISVLLLVGSDFENAIGWLRSPMQAALFILFTTVVFWHTVQGLQVIVEDYFHTEWLKIAVLIAIKMFIVLVTVVVILLILRIFLGV